MVCRYRQSGLVLEQHLWNGKGKEFPRSLPRAGRHDGPVCSVSALIRSITWASHHRVTINYSKWRSDILILLHDSPPSLITTSDSFYDDANNLRDDLLDARKKWGLDSME